MEEIHIKSIKERCIILGKYLVEHRATVRFVATQFNISKSTVHKDITHGLEKIDKALLSEVQKILETNKKERHIRGGEATRKKYSNISTERKKFT